MARQKEKEQISCPPRVVKQCEGSRFYFVPGTGLSQCLGTEKSVIFETELDVVSFTPVEDFRASEKRSIPSSRIAQSNIRELATKDELTSLFLRIRNSRICHDLPDYKVKKNQNAYNDDWEGILNSGKLDDYADIIVHVFKLKELPSPTEVKFANRAMNFLAVERSFVIGETLKDSLDLVKEICGQKARTEELARYGFTQKPETPVITGPS